MQTRLLAVVGSTGLLIAAQSVAQLPPGPAASITVTNTHKQVKWTPYPGADGYNVLSAVNASGPYTNDQSGTFLGNRWLATNTFPDQFFKVGAMPMDSNALLTATVLNRLAYGPTPDELERVSAMGPQAYIDEQLAPENIVETGDAYLAVTTNSAPFPITPTWTQVVVTGVVSSSTLLIYLQGPGEEYLDGVQLQLILTSYTTNVTATNTIITTNVYLGPNVLANGGFESPLAGNGTNSWAISANLIGSGIDTSQAYEGAGCLHAVATSGGSGQSSAIWQTVVPSLPTANNQKCVLSFWYLPSATSRQLVLRLLSSGTITSARDQLPDPTWVYATATGIATATGTLYIYTSGAGETYLDDIKLVAGTAPDAGPNLLVNGDFESPLTNGWLLTANFTNSYISSNIAHAGACSLKLVATAAGSGSGNALYQLNIPGITNNATYTVSFRYIPSTRGRTLTVRLSGSGTPGLLIASPDTTAGGIRRRLDTIGTGHAEYGVTARTIGGASLGDLRAWWIMNAVGAKRQLLEVLGQFLENHFVTEQSKSVSFLSGSYGDGTIQNILATDWEYSEHVKWRAALMRPDCTFYDLLKVSAESPAMIVYLDTVNSKGNAANVANENYARELFELFTMGVDNGYDQNDIVAQSRAWTGWSVAIVDQASANNPFAPQSTAYGFYPGSGYNAVSNLIGVWAFNFKSANHGTNRAPLLSAWDPNATRTNLISLGPKLVPARFGPPWAGMSYQLVIPARATGTTNGIQDGYDVIWHLANNVPMTAEYISVKLCRVFVHDNFPNPTTRPELPEYAFYDYTNPNLSAEARLVHDCMLAWWNSTPRGNIRAVLQTIFNSELFRGQGGSFQKIKTPLEYCVSAVRALRSDNSNGTFTASTDGYSIPTPLSRMGTMLLFDRDFPDGYPESGSPWISAGTLAERIRYVQASLMALSDSHRTDAGNNFTDPVALLKKKLPSTSWNNAVVVAEYFVRVLYPGEGRANLDLYRAAAVNFLNTSDDGASASLFSGLSGSNYDTRVRATVSMLMTLPRFHEQ